MKLISLNYSLIKNVQGDPRGPWDICRGKTLLFQKHCYSTFIYTDPHEFICMKNYNVILESNILKNQQLLPGKS